MICGTKTVEKGEFVQEIYCIFTLTKCLGKAVFCSKYRILMNCV